jgi:hypothetical protein
MGERTPGEQDDSATSPGARLSRPAAPSGGFAEAAKWLEFRAEPGY